MKDENSCQVVVEQSSAEPARRSYAAPKLRHLGSVRELTFVSKGVPLPDALVSKSAPM